MHHVGICSKWLAARRWAFAASVAVTLSLGVAQHASAQADPFIAPAIPAVPVVPTQFDITGFIQEATLDTAGAICKPADPRLAGGTVTVNGHRIVIPCNTILQMPAFTLTWADLFRTAGNPLVPTDIVPPGQTGLALNDRIGSVPGATIPAAQAGLLTAVTPVTPYSGSLPSYEVHVVGNVVNQQYIAGLVFISQHALNAGQGRISCIDYATGEMQVGGMPVDPTVAPFGCPSPAPAGVTRVRLNDTIGRYGLAHAGPGGCSGRTNCVEEVGFDPRFTPDTDNPTIHAATGYPMCIPRVNPFDVGAVDPECPQSNRPLAPSCRTLTDFGYAAFANPPVGYCMTYVMDPPDAPRPAGITCPGPDRTCPNDPTKQTPLEIGDNIVFNGTLKSDSNGVYLSAHTIAANVGIYTYPTTWPSYTFVEEVLAGTDARPVAGLSQEATGRVKFVGFTTDIFSYVDLFALDQDPLTGAVTERLLGTQSPIATPLIGRFRTPANNNGAFLPPTRNYRAVSRSMCSLTSGGGAPCTPENRNQVRVANGLQAGQYLLPNFQFIFAENLQLGQTLVPNNLQDLPFLFCGSGPVDGPGTGSPVAGQLDPTPWAPPMDDPIFRSSLCPTARAVSAAVFPPVVGPPDVLRVTTSTWDNRQNKGKLNLVVTSSADPAPAGMFMQATLVNTNLAPGVPGSPSNPIVASMVLAGATPIAPAVCPTASPCWQLLAPGFIVDPTGNGIGQPTMVPPNEIFIRSSLGGTTSTAAILALPCAPTKRVTCQ